MTTQHTAEPWHLSERPNGPFLGIYSNFTIDGKPCFSGRQAIASVHYESKKGAAKYHEMFKANARRIVACVNACAGIPTSTLESIQDFERAGVKTIATVEKQRDQLLEALKGCVTEMSALRCSLATFTGASAGVPGEEEAAARAAIAAAEGSE